jgi:hypothetical protein
MTPEMLFINRLTERYGTPKNPQFTDDIVAYLEQAKPDLNKLYTIIVDNHEYENFPNRAKIKHFWESFGTAAGLSDGTRETLRSIARFHEKWGREGSREIVRLYKSILKKDVAARTFAQREFLSQWELVNYHWDRLTDEGASETARESYCDVIKNAVARGEKLTPEFNPLEELQGERVGLTTFDEAVSLDFGGVR